MTTGSERTPLLVVDDEPPIRRLLRTSLGAEGFEVFEADNAEKAFATIEAKKPEIVILDLGLPDQDGLDVIRRIRRSGSKLPIVSCRAGATSAARSRRWSLARTIM